MVNLGVCGVKLEIRTEQHSEFSEDAEKGQGDSLYLVVGSITIG